MKKTKIIFFGTPGFAVEPLKVINNNFDVLCVVTSPDKKSGRGLKINESEVKKFSSQNKIPIKQPYDLTNNDFIDGWSDFDSFVVIKNDTILNYKKLINQMFPSI